MASRDLESQVIYLIAHECGLAREKVHLSDRLLRDLGMDGDDAADFFISVHERFGTDLTHLQEHWGQHFGPEGFSCWNGLILLLAAIIGGVVAGVAGLSAVWGVAVGVGLLAAWVWMIGRWGPPDKMVPLTVADVVVAVEAGAWPSRPDA